MVADYSQELIQLSADANNDENSSGLKRKNSRTFQLGAISDLYFD